ncbi:MAG: hypothetical protein ACLGQH_10425 [Acidobacteriota bacterium]
MKTHAFAVRQIAALAGLAPCLAANDALAETAAVNAESGDMLINLILLGLAMFILLRFITGRSKKQGPTDPNQTPSYQPPDDDRLPLDPTPPGKPNMYSNAQATWDMLKTPDKTKSAPQSVNGGNQPLAPASPDEEFLAGAKLAYNRISTSLANRDYDDLTSFVSPPLLAQLKNTMPATPAGKPDILLVEASLAGRTDGPDRTTMTVDYNVLRRDPGSSQNSERNERWTFARDNTTPGANWLLDRME